MGIASKMAVSFIFMVLMFEYLPCSSDTAQNALDQLLICAMKKPKCNITDQKFRNNSRCSGDSRQANSLLYYRAKFLTGNHINFYNILSGRDRI